ncbi:type IIL restriction-modification enzyme MmeI [Chordicoccus furentiruminis]|uniref:type IIL restriction-modification enzyme MmeI n=1 Tax=Chordicoccus furentiruminis TaxID=2709410 RepID=UPI002ED08910
MRAPGLPVLQYVGSRDFINNDEKRYCLWLRDVNPRYYRQNKEVKRRLEAVSKMRRESTAKPTRQAAETPYLFFSAPQKKDVRYLAIPEVSSQRRRYIPMGFLPEGWIASNKLLIVENADCYDFGVLTSNVHMAWVRCVTGRLKSDYQYSGAIDYNTFPWPTPTEDQKNRISQTAQGILDARALYPDSSLADLYDPLTMPPELRKAHTRNDIAVMQAYGFSTKMSESDCVGELMRMYQKLTAAE